MEMVGSREGWLLLFNLKTTVPWEQRLYAETVEQEGRIIRIFGA